eukprot:8469768-Alexandrium_andersonii.AAC.1
MCIRDREFGGSSLVVKQCLSWIDIWRTGRTPHGRDLLEPPNLQQGRRYPFVVVSDSTLSFRPSEISSRGNQQEGKREIDRGLQFLLCRLERRHALGRRPEHERVELSCPGPRELLG